jgi:hypothetical protein
MQFEGEELRGILNQQSDLVAIHDRCGFPRGEALEPLLAIKSVGLDLYVGVGNRRRIRYLRPLADAARPPWRGGSHTTERIRNDWGVIIGAPNSGLQHKPLPREN